MPQPGTGPPNLVTGLPLVTLGVDERLPLAALHLLAKAITAALRYALKELSLAKGKVHR